MEKHQVLSFIESQLAQGSITRADLQSIALNGTAPITGMVTPPSIPVEAGGTVVMSAPASVALEPKKNIVNVFYGIGVIIILTGIVILVAQHWTDIGFAGRLLVSLGIACVGYAVGMMMRKPEQRTISQVFFTLSAVLAPLGAYVLITEQGGSFDLVAQIITAVVTAVLLVIAWVFTRRDILPIFAVLHLSWAYYAGLFKFLENLSLTGDILSWATLALGVSYLCIGAGYKPHALSDATGREGRAVRTTLYALGGLAMLGAGFALDGVWDLAYIGLLFGTFYLSVYLKTRSLLILAGIFLIAHLIYLTSKYFANMIGWPIALVISGFIIIGIGYATFYVMKKYMK